MAGIAGGLGGAVGLAAESVYGTFVPSTRWIEVHSAKMQNVPHISQGTGLAYGRVTDLGSRRRPNYFDAKGTVELEFLNQGMALLLANAFGSNATLAQMGTTSAYQMSCNLGVPDNQNYLSMQTLVPDAGGNIKQQNFSGCKFTSIEFTADEQNPLMWTLDVDAQQWQNTTAAGTPSYTANSRTFTAQGMGFKVGAYGSEATIDGVKKISCKIERGLTTDRIYLGNSVKSEPVTNALVKVTGSADVDLTVANKPVLWDIFNTQAAVPSVVMTFVGNQIGSSTYSDTLVLNAPNVFIDTGGTPELDGPGMTTATVAWTGLIDTSSDPVLKATLTTADTTF